MTEQPPTLPDRSRLAIRVEAAQRLLMWHALSRLIPLYLVTEFPKSGGSWFCQMLSAYLDIPYPRNRMPRFRRSVLQGHHRYSPHFHNVCCVLRDGRDVVVSYYHHRLLQHDRNNRAWVARTRAAFPCDDYEDVRGNLPRFIDFVFGEGARGPSHFTWSEFVRDWLDKPVVHVRYEDLLADAVGTMSRTVAALTGERVDPERMAQVVERYSFAAQARRRAGQESKGSFLRKGIAGDWRNQFTRDAAERFARHAGAALVAAGYEEDDSWVATVGD